MRRSKFRSWFSQCFEAPNICNLHKITLSCKPRDQNVIAFYPQETTNMKKYWKTKNMKGINMGTNRKNNDWKTRNMKGETRNMKGKNKETHGKSNCPSVRPCLLVRLSACLLVHLRRWLVHPTAFFKTNTTSILPMLKTKQIRQFCNVKKIK